MVVDTNIFIECLRAGNKKNTTLYRLAENMPLFLSTITIFELLAGATTIQKRAEVAIVTVGVNVLPFEKTAAEKAGEIYLQLRRKSQLIEFRDIFIAATAIVHGLPLATLNTKHFSRIDGLVLQKI